MSKLTSKLSYVKKGSESLKVIIPLALAQIMELKHGGTVTWDIETVKGKKALIVRKK
jgi:antitoxin component of MazEF toxin-antitoxin module